MMASLFPLAWFADIKVLGFSLIFAIIYAWSRYEPEVLINFFWGFQVKGVHLPFVLLGLSLLMKQSILIDLIGLVVGEVFYLLKEKVPQDYGYDLLVPPMFFEKLISKIKQPRVARAQNPGFGGRGHRLG